MRDEQGTELIELFEYRRDRTVAERGGLGPGFWAAMTRDTLVSAWRERRDPLDRRGRPPVGSEGGGDTMTGWIDDLRYAGRRLSRSPGFTVTALTILVLGIGVNATAFSLVNALLLQPPPFASPEEVVVVLQDDDGGAPSSTSYPAFRDMARFDVFASISAFYSDQAFLDQDGTLAPLLVEYGTAEYMDVVGLAPARGTWFTAEHDDPGGPPVAVVTYGMWADRMASDPGVIGSTIRINGSAVTVIGVGPPEFNGGRGPTAIDLWLSISAMGPTGGRVASLEQQRERQPTVRTASAVECPQEQSTGTLARHATRGG